MNIKVGKYILRSDQYSMWVMEEYTDKNGKTATKRVTGYGWNINNLMRMFSEAKVYGSDAENMGQLIAIMRDTMSDMAELNAAAVENGFKLLAEVGAD